MGCANVLCLTALKDGVSRANIDEIRYLIEFADSDKAKSFLREEVSAYLDSVSALDRRLTLADYRVIERFVMRYMDEVLPEIKHPFFREHLVDNECVCSGV